MILGKLVCREMRKTSCMGNWKVRGPRTAETEMHCSRQVSPRVGCTAPKTQRTEVGASLTKESIPDKGGRYSGAWATKTGCSVICRPFPGAGCTAPHIRLPLI